ncbi:phenylalanine--tRNA ligase subunit beta [soil metagenome]
MRVSLRWLQDYVAIDVPTDALAHRLDMSGTKVEEVFEPAGSVDGIVVAEVRDVSAHPNADNLTLVDVELGGGAMQRVVCGARNFAAGDRVPLATVGSRLPGMVVAERRIRGETSHGMLCSAAELGVSKDHSGILVLPPDAPLGGDVVSLLGLDDTIIELEVTPNRPDCLGMIGVAREVAALLGSELRIPVDELVSSEGAVTPVAVDIQDDEGCPRYVALGIEGVSIARSPSWLAARLLAAGVRPISNVVDVTNYVMLETGQPLHAFDASRIDDGTIVVRRATPGEALITLDGVERELGAEDLVIADPRKVLGLAGVIGGARSEVSETTNEIVLESASFRPASVAGMSRRHLLRTEASARFERGVDPNGADVAARRAAQLIAEVAGGKVARDPVDKYEVRIEPVAIRLRPARTSAILGSPVPADEQSALLRSIGLTVTEAGDDLTVEVPTFRPDLDREIDLVEEVGRLAGYDRLPSTVPSGPKGGLDPSQAAERRLRRVLVGVGASEVWTQSFGAPKDLDLLGLPPEHPARAMVELANPTSDDELAMRTTLLSGLLRSAARNFAHRADGVALFEVARIYQPVGEQLPREPLMLGGVFGGERGSPSWRSSGSRWDFFAVKGVLEAALGVMGLPALAFDWLAAMPWHPTRAAKLSLDGSSLGELGHLHPDVCGRFAVPEDTVAFELILDELLGALPARPQVAQLPKFPGVYIDVALVVDDGVPAADIERTIRSSGAPEVTSVRLFDVYRGEQVAEGRKSLAYALEVRSPDKTLTDEDALAVRDRIVDALARATGAELRS